MQENKGAKGDIRDELPAYSLKHSDVATCIGVGQHDLEIIQMYRHIFRRPMLAVLHYMIFTAAKCWEEHHNRIIKEMEEKRSADERIITEYIKRFGRIGPRSI